MVALSASETVLNFEPKNKRRVLLVSPKYSPSFGTFNHTFPLVGVQAFMPPQGILLIAALLPKQWEIKFVDENISPAKSSDFQWADAVFISGMHIQKNEILDINERAHEFKKVTVLGGPSVSAAPEFYPKLDLLHLGEVGDGTIRLFRHLDETVQRPDSQISFQTVDRLSMTEFPSPSYHLTNVRKYLLGSVQFSSGCPFTCEFCDIPGLYGRNPRLKTPEQIIRELDTLAEMGADAIYFVDDNFIGNPKATLELLPHVVEWQRKRDYSVGLSCEATLNISSHPKILKLMQEAYFNTIFCGIETPEPHALKAISKRQNLRSPILESIDILNQHGMEVASGIILGFDSDTDQTPQAIKDFADSSQIPIMTVNLLYALPHTALYNRLEKEKRLLPDTDRDSNIDFLVPYETVVSRWMEVISYIYHPRNIYARFRTQVLKVYPNREKPRYPLKRLSIRNLKRFFRILFKLVWEIGIKSDYRSEFWKMAWTEIRKGNIEDMISMSMVAHHLILYSRECIKGKMQSSNYSMRIVRPDQEKDPVFVPSEILSSS